MRLRGKKYLWTLFILMFLASMANISIPTTPTTNPKVIFKVDPPITSGESPNSLVLVNVSIEADPGAAIVGWRICLKVDPDVLEPGYEYGGYEFVAWTGSGGYFLYDWCVANGWDPDPGEDPTIGPHNSEEMIGIVNQTAGTITNTTESIKNWIDLEVGNGTDGPGNLVMFYFTSKSSSAWSLIEITEAYYFTTWNSPDLDKRVPDLIINGHYNTPAHDVAVTDVSAPPEATVGDSVPINVSILNQGANAETFNLNVSYDSTVFNTTSVSLASGASDMEPFTWNTTNLTPGTYNITAKAILGNDVDPSNDERTTTIELKPAGGDAAVTNVVPSENQTYQAWTINVTVTVLNNGTDPISFNVTAYYENVTAAYEIGTQTVPDLAGGAEMNVTFSWNHTLTGVALGLYDVKANATIIGLNDINPGNNEFVVYNATKVKYIGDVDGSAKVDYKDLWALGSAYGSVPGHPRWNKQCDFDESDKVDYKDLWALGAKYGDTTDAYLPDP